MKRHSFAWLLGAAFFTTLGDAFGLLAMEWMVYDLTGSKLSMGALALCAGIPELAIRLAGAPLTDRVNKRKLLIILAAVKAGAAVLPLLAASLGSLQIWHLFITAGVMGACSALYLPAASAALPAIAPKGKLVRAFAVMEGCRGAAALLGPSLAGGATAVFGSLQTLGINAVIYSAAAGLLFMVPGASFVVMQKADSQNSRAGYVRELLQGFAFYQQHRPILLVMLLVSVSNMGSAAVWTMMVPYGTEILRQGPGAIGLLTTFSSLGSLLGVAAVAVAGDLHRRSVWMPGSLALIGLLTLLLGFTTSYGYAVVLVSLSGAAGPFFSSLSSALYGRLVPEELQGRVNAIRYLIGGSLQPVGGGLGGVIGQAFGIPALFAGVGMVSLVCSVSAFFSPALRRLNGPLDEVADRFAAVEHACHETTQTANGHA